MGHDGAGVFYETESQEVDGDDDGEGVEDGEVIGFLLGFGGGGGCRGRRRDFAEEEHGEEADGEGDDGEHDEEGRWVIVKQSSTEIGENGGAETDVAFENAGNWAAILSEVSDAGYEHRRVHPCRAVSAHT